MKIDVDWARCEGHGLCAAAAPTMFGLDDDGDLHYAHGDSELPEADVTAARSAVGACPVAALREVE